MLHSPWRLGSELSRSSKSLALLFPESNKPHRFPFPLLIEALPWHTNLYWDTVFNLIFLGIFTFYLAPRHVNVDGWMKCQYSNWRDDLWRQAKILPIDNYFDVELTCAILDGLGWSFFVIVYSERLLNVFWISVLFLNEVYLRSKTKLCPRGDSGEVFVYCLGNFVARERCLIESAIQSVFLVYLMSQRGHRTGSRGNTLPKKVQQHREAQINRKSKHKPVEIPIRNIHKPSGLLYPAKNSTVLPV